MPISSLPAPVGPGGNPFFDPRFGYWNNVEFPFPRRMPEANWAYGEQNPEAAWTSTLARLGYGGTDPRGQWGRSLYGRAQEGYAAAKQKSIGLDWQDYLKTINLDRMYAGLGPEEKGYSDQQFGGPARWQRRV